MFAQIERVFNIRLPVATLFEASTIEDLARILHGEVVHSRWSPLVPIQPSGSRPPFFCFHGDGGNVLIYKKLSQHLGPDQPVYGLQAQGLDGTSPILRTIEEMAALYLKDVRRIQPHGPYLLGGYCMGGTLAYEVAQQIHAAGERVALLALFDTMNWHKARLTIWHNIFLRFQRLTFHAAVLFGLDAEGKRKFLKEKFDELRSRIPVWRGLLLTRLLRKNSDGGVPGPTVLGQIWRSNDSASRNYVPVPYPGAVMDFRPARQYRVLNKPDLKWSGLAKGGQRVIVIPAYPTVMLLEPWVKDLASRLMKCIDDAIQCCKSGQPGKVSGSFQGADMNPISEELCSKES
jgi:thioesterase domain-containing protein